MKKQPVISAVLLAFLCSANLIAQTPVKVLTQSLLDTFIKDMPLILSDEIVSDTWESFTQETLMQGITDPNFSLMTGEGVYQNIFTLQKNVCEKMKSHKYTQTVLSKQNWKSNFWDVYLVLMIGLPYAHLEEIQKHPELSELTADFDTSEMPESNTFIHPDDYSLIKKNLQKIRNLMDEEYDVLQ